MAFPFFKKKEEVKPAPVAEKVEEKPAATPAPKRVVKKGAYISALASPHVTEKATVLAGRNEYIFKVIPNTTKLQVKRAVEQQYGVEVKGVNMITVPSKKKRLGKIKGIKKGYRKAIVKVAKGQTIEILPR